MNNPKHPKTGLAKKRPTGVVTFVVTLTIALAFLATTAMAPDPNHGTVKVKDVRLDDTANEPHVDCEFYIRGFNMAAPNGTITIRVWNPTGDGDVVLESTWTAGTSVDAEVVVEADGFLAGPYTLPSGHYKLFVSNAEGHFKHKVFWVDCEPAPTTPPPVETTPPGTDTPPTTTEIPFFPSTAAIVLGSLGLLGAAGIMLRRRL